MDDRKQSWKPVCVFTILTPFVFHITLLVVPFTKMVYSNLIMDK